MGGDHRDEQTRLTDLNLVDQHSFGKLQKWASIHPSPRLREKRVAEDFLIEEFIYGNLQQMQASRQIHQKRP
jgi:hypothetical protein